MEVLRIQGVNHAQEEEALQEIAPPLRAAEGGVDEEIVQQRDAEYFEHEGADFMEDPEDDQ